MKESKYNIHLLHNDRNVVFNSRTTATAVIDEEALALFKHLETGNTVEKSALALQMREVGFLIDEETDELQQLEMQYYFGKYGQSGISLVIAPTMYCNFACPYCYEGVHSDDVMSQETQGEVMALIERFAKEGQNVFITWFGGEPLLCKETIYKMSEEMLKICQREAVEYSAEIITNGYLLDVDTVKNLSRYRVETVQVTIDGMPETHNSRRKLRNKCNSPTFEKILENIIMAKSFGLEMAVRISVDKQTVGELEQILDLMIENDLGEDVYLGRIEGNTDGARGCECDCLRASEYAKTSLNFENMKLQRGLKTQYPSPIRTNCGAGYQHSFVIDTKGYLYKCWNDIGIIEKSVGNIQNFDDIERNPNRNYSSWMVWSPFHYTKCRECKVLPICMGGCQYEGQSIGLPNCESWKHEIEGFIKLKCEEVM